MSFGTTLLAAVFAGALSAHLAGGLFGSYLAGGLLLLLAPFPILLVGFMFLPLAALAAGLIGAVLLAITNAGGNPFAYLIVAALPSFAATWLVLLRGSGPLFNKQNYVEIGTVAFILTLVLATSTVFVMIMAEPDYAAFRSANYAMALQMATRFVADMPQGSAPMNPEVFADALAQYGPSASMLFVQSLFFFLVYLAARIARQSGRFMRPWPDFATARLPIVGLSIMGAALLLLMFGGWTGVFGGFVFVGLLTLLILIGLAVIHHRARTRANSSWMVPAAWIALVVASPFMLMIPALLIAGLGIADHIFDLRGLRHADKNDTTNFTRR
jgi:hypothetical protein